MEFLVGVIILIIILLICTLWLLHTISRVRYNSLDINSMINLGIGILQLVSCIIFLLFCISLLSLSGAPFYLITMLILLVIFMTLWFLFKNYASIL